MSSIIEIGPQTCRICLEDDTELVADVQLFAQSVWNIAQIELKDDPSLPDKICEKCSSAFNEANSLREMCLQNQKQLNEFLEQKVLAADIDDEDMHEEVKEDEAFEIIEEPFIIPKCCLCSHAFLKQDFLIFHCWEKHKCQILKPSESDKITEPLKCIICLTSFPEYSDLAKHRTCDICFGSFLTDSELLTHQTQEHNEAVTEFVDVASTSTDGISKKTVILKEKSESKETSKKRTAFNCCQCSFRADFLSHVKEHFSLKHKDLKVDNPQPSKLACPWCLKEFPDKQERQTHLRSGREGLLDCSECGKVFNTIQQLAKHRDKDHVGCQAYSCDECDKVFGKFVSLKSHKYLQHNEANIFKCDTCGKVFNRRMALEEHMNSHNGIFPYLCANCPARFPRQSGLTHHMRTHTKEKPFKCKYCDKAYSHFTDVKRHQFSHTGDYPFSCEKCKKGFAKKGALITHMRTHMSVAERLALQRAEIQKRNSENSSQIKNKNP